jgi:molybdate/tungstate transport system permease protein
MSWARAVSEFAAVIMLVGFFPMIAPGLIWSRWQSEGLMAAMAVAVLLIIVCLAVFIGLRYLRGRLFAER